MSVTSRAYARLAPATFVHLNAGVRLHRTVQLEISLQRSDFGEHIDYVSSRVEREGALVNVLRVLIWAVAVFGFSFLFDDLGLSHAVLFFGSMLLLFVMEAVSRGRNRRRILDELVAESEPSSTLEFSDDGIIVATSHTHSTIGWPAIRRVVDGKNLFQLFVAADQVLLVPKRYLEDPVSFGQSIQRWRDAA
ncbi:MAG: YcxB family protein [Cyanobacteria bacterium J06648_11]